MNISGRSCLGCVEVRMSIHPNDTESLVFRCTANRTSRQAVVPSQHKREAPTLNGSCYCPGNTPRHWNNAINILKFGISDAACLLNGNFNIAFIIEAVSQLFKLLMKMCISYSAGTHVHTATVCTEINGNTDNIYLHEYLYKFL